jgi:hypothetical protein
VTPIGLALGIDVLTVLLGIVPQLVKESAGGANRLLCSRDFQ